MGNYVNRYVGKLTVEEFALRNDRSLNKVLRQMTAPELRRAASKEWSGLRRRSLLLKITKRICALNRAEELRPVLALPQPTVSPRRTGRWLTCAELEARIEARFNREHDRDRRRDKSNANEIRRLTVLLQRRRQATCDSAVAEARAAGRTHLSKRALQRFKKEVGDHDHQNLNAGQLCGICGEERDL
jgi:hypothetical protein